MFYFLRLFHHSFFSHWSFSPVSVLFDWLFMCLLFSDVSGDSLLALNAVHILMENLKDQLRHEAPKHEKLSFMLLANLTRSKKGILQFLKFGSKFAKGTEEAAEGAETSRISVLSELLLQRLMDLFFETRKAASPQSSALEESVSV